MEGGNGTCGNPGLLAALNHDALEEVFTHCTARDLLALRQSCRAACELLGRSEKVWVAKLRDSFGLGLKAHAASDGLFVRLARRVYEASSSQPLRFQGVFVNGGVDEDAMHYFVDNLFRPDKAPYCSNCSRDADCIALLLDGEVPRDAEFARVRQYMIRRCLYAAALIMNVQMPEHNRDPDSILHLLDDWTDIQLEGFYRDLVMAMQADHALGRLLLHGIDHERVPAEQQRILGVHQWLLDRPKTMKDAMLKPAGEPNVIFDTSVLPKLTGAPGTKRMAGVVHEVTLSRVGNLTCPVAAGAVLVGTIDHSKLQGWSADDVLALLRQAALKPAAAALSGLVEASEVGLMAAAGQLPPILCTDETMAGVWHEFDTSDAAAAQQAAAAASASPHLRMAAEALRARQQRLAQEPQPGAAEEAAEEATAAAAAGPSSGAQQRQVLPADIICWRPLLWFKFHSAEEAVGFVQRNRLLVERHGAQATVRHSGPAPTRRGHVIAQAAAEAATAAAAAAQAGNGVQGAPAPAPQALAVAQMLHHQVHQGHHHVEQQAQQAQQAQHQLGQTVQAAPQQQALQPMLQQQQEQQEQQPRTQMQAQALAQPPQPAHHQQQAEPASGVDAEQWPAASLAAGPAASGNAVPPAVPLHSQSDSEDDSEGSDGLGGGEADDLSDDSGSDEDEEEGAQGAWLANWVQDEFGADLQEQDVVVAGEGLPFDAMDEDESSEDEEDEDALLAAEEHFALPLFGALDGVGAGAAAGPAGPGAGAGAPAAGAHAPQVQGSAAETLLRAVSRRSTRARNRLRVALTRPAGGNILLVKLINQENLMEHYGDPHTWPNIDMTLVSLAGRLVELPEEAHLTH